MKLIRAIKCAGLIGALTSFSSLYAVTVTLNSGGTNVGGTIGGIGHESDNNTRTFTAAGGLSVAVTGWTQMTTGGAFSQSFVGQYSGGLGVINDGEDGTAPNHTVDDSGYTDYLFFKFNQQVDLNSFFLGYVDTDSDLKVWIGNSVTAPTGFFGSLPFSQTSTASNGSTRTVTLSGSIPFGDSILIGAYGTDGTSDYFKVQSLDVTPKPPGGPTVPDGGSTCVLLGLSAMALAAFRKRR